MMPLTFAGDVNVIELIFAMLCLAGILYMMFRPYKEDNDLKSKAKSVQAGSN